MTNKLQFDKFVLNIILSHAHAILASRSIDERKNTKNVEKLQNECLSKAYNKINQIAERYRCISLGITSNNMGFLIFPKNKKYKFLESNKSRRRSLSHIPKKYFLTLTFLPHLTQENINEICLIEILKKKFNLL